MCHLCAERQLVLIQDFLSLMDIVGVETSLCFPKVTKVSFHACVCVHFMRRSVTEMFDQEMATKDHDAQYTSPVSGVKYSNQCQNGTGGLHQLCGAIQQLTNTF